MKRLIRVILIFSFLFAVLTISPAFLSQQFSPYPLIKVGDVIDLLTPLILIPIYWILFQLRKDQVVSLGETIAFLILAVLWVDGHGMHLAANSIGHLLEDAVGSDTHTLTYFFDEILSHYFWHLGVIGMSVLLLYRQWRYPFEKESSLWKESLAGLFHGLNIFIIFIEGRTAAVGIPYTLSVVIFTLIWGRKQLRHQPLLAFFFAACTAALILIAGWWIYWGYLPEFSKIGIIK
jgi:hypothetical protein